MNNSAFFIAQRLIRQKLSGRQASGGTRPIILISMGSIAIGIAVMILAVFIVTGFQKEIRSKVIGFGSHIQITHFNAMNALESSPIYREQDFYPSLEKEDGVRKIQVYVNKAGIIKTDEEFYGVMVKGVYKDFDWTFFTKNLVEGEPLHWDDSTKSNEVLISKVIAQKLNLKLSDRLLVYFIQNNQPRPRKFTVGGIYSTGLQKFDEVVLLVDIRHLQRINDWEENQVSGFEVLLDSYDDLEKMDGYIYNFIGSELYSKKITEAHQDIFGWLELQDMNVLIIIALMILVSSINMISALLILILERSTMIGMLKALGANNWYIRKIFLFQAAYLAARGLLIGNAVGLGLAFLQWKFHVIALPQDQYYLEHVPINFDFFALLWVNAGTLALSILMLLIPSAIIASISPVKAIRFN